MRRQTHRFAADTATHIFGRRQAVDSIGLPPTIVAATTRPSVKQSDGRTIFDQKAGSPKVDFSSTALFVTKRERR
jgi:hypothetical protein